MKSLDIFEKTSYQVRKKNELVRCSIISFNASHSIKDTHELCPMNREEGLVNLRIRLVLCLFGYMDKDVICHVEIKLKSYFNLGNLPSV